MGAGAVLHTTGKSKLTELGGLAQKQPMILWLYMIGACSISGFPLLNGFISKSMVVAAAGEAHHGAAMLLLLLASVGTFLSVGLNRITSYNVCYTKLLRALVISAGNVVTPAGMDTGSDAAMALKLSQ